MSTLTYRGISSSFLGLVENSWSRCGMFRPFSSRSTHAARRIPTDEELSTMPYYQRWYYTNMEDPAFRERRSEPRRLEKSETHAKMLALPKSPERTRYVEARRAAYRRTAEKKRDSRGLSQWLRRLPDDQREAFDWKTHLPVLYPERVHKTCSTCLNTYKHGSKLWWQDIQEPGKFICHICYTKDGLAAAMPKGHENFVIGAGMRWPMPWKDSGREKSSRTPATKSKPDSSNTSASEGSGSKTN